MPGRAQRSYLMKRHGKVVERPQHMFLRVAVGIHGDNIEVRPPRLSSRAISLVDDLDAPSPVCAFRTC